jgi:nucleotide-binding universal stress UspA family protein
MKILVGYHGSNLSERALDLAREHAKAFNAKMYILHSKVTDLPQNAHEKDKQNLEKVKSSLEKENIHCETILTIVNKSPGEHLVNFAEENEIDEIIVGVRSKSRVGKFLLGSTAQYVILQAPCPVVTVK